MKKIEVENIDGVVLDSKKTISKVLEETIYEFVNPVELEENKLHYIFFTSGDPRLKLTQGKFLDASITPEGIKKFVCSILPYEYEEKLLDNVYLFSVPTDGSLRAMNMDIAQELHQTQNIPWKKLEPKNDEFGRPWWKKYKDVTNQYITIRKTNEKGEVELKYYDVSTLNRKDVVLLVRNLMNETKSELVKKEESKLDQELNYLKQNVNLVNYKHDHEMILYSENIKQELSETLNVASDATAGSGNLEVTPNTSLLEETFTTKLESRLGEYDDPMTSWFDATRRKKVTVEELCGMKVAELKTQTPEGKITGIDFQVRNDSEKAIMNILEEKAAGILQNKPVLYKSLGVPETLLKKVADELNNKPKSNFSDKVTFNGDENTIKKAFDSFSDRAKANGEKTIQELLTQLEQEENKEEDKVIQNILSDVETKTDKRMFYVDVGNVPTEKLESFMKNVKEELAKETSNPLQKEDMVNHPKHYTQGKIEVSDFIIDQKLDFLAGNIVKYVCRHKFKGTPVQDLKKARWYLDKLIEVSDKENK